jgi:iron complex transport system substrate-binding protein
LNSKIRPTVVLFLAILGIGWTCSRTLFGAEEKAVPRRIVSMAPNITETVFALGCGDRLVAVTDFCVYPPEALALPKVGGFYNPNLERMAVLNPDLVLLQGKHEKVDRFCDGRHIRVLHVAMDSLASIYSGIGRLGEALGVPDRAAGLNRAIGNDLEAVRRAAHRHSTRKVFVSLGRAMGSMANLYTVGGTSFLSEVLRIAGGENVFGDVKLPYPEASKESLVRRAPEVILEMRPGEAMAPERQRQIVAEWAVFKTIPAVRDGKVFLVTEDFVLVPGPRVAAVARILAGTLHGEL